MEIDLASANAESLSFNSRHPLSEALSKELLDVCVGDRKKGGWPQVMAARYIVGERLHECASLVSQANGGFRVSFTYFLGRQAGPRPTRSNKPQQLLDCLSRVSDLVQFDCFALFEYPEGSRQSMIALPVRPFAYSLLPFDEIRGLRLAKLREGSAEGVLDYSVIMDRPSNREVHHSITFAFEGSYSQELPFAILSRAKEISLKFYREE